MFQDSSRHDVGGHQARGSARSKDGRFQPFVERSGLPATVVSSLAEDREGHLWVGTGRGLFRSNAAAVMRGAAHATCSSREMKTDGALDGYVRVVFADRAGTIWVGTNLDGLIAYENSGS